RVEAPHAARSGRVSPPRRQGDRHSGAPWAAHHRTPLPPAPGKHRTRAERQPPKPSATTCRNSSIVVFGIDFPPGAHGAPGVGACAVWGLLRPDVTHATRDMPHRSYVDREALPHLESPRGRCFT